MSKRLKRLPDGGYTLETAAAVEDVELLCRRCGTDDCTIGLVMRKMEVNRMNAKAMIAKCKSFTPVIDFLDEKGLVGRFNTFRLGAAWAERVVEGQSVKVRCDASTQNAIVRSIHLGTVDEMLEQHGIDNHLSIHAAVTGDTEFDLAAVIKRIYGPHRLRPESSMTVIYLEIVSAEGADN